VGGGGDPPVRVGLSYVVGGGGDPLRVVASARMINCLSVELPLVELPSVELPSMEGEARRVLQNWSAASRSW
jgi:hypothetical protein